jgi:hypothetical protein
MLMILMLSFQGFGVHEHFKILSNHSFEKKGGYNILTCFLSASKIQFKGDIAT